MKWKSIEVFSPNVELALSCDEGTTIEFSVYLNYIIILLITLSNQMLFRNINSLGLILILLSLHPQTSKVPKCKYFHMIIRLLFHH